MLVPPRIYRLALVIALLVGVGFFANPWIINPDGEFDPVGEGLLIAEGLAGIAWCMGVCVVRLRSFRATPEPSPREWPAVPWPVWPRWVEIPLTLTIVGFWWAVHWRRLADPELSTDDAIYLSVARSWEATSKNLLTPFAEHLCPITRLFTWAICATFDESHWPRALALSGMTLFAATFLPLAYFVRREWHSPTLSILAFSLFALTKVHSEVVTWYSASQWCWALLLLLASLLILQSGNAAPKWWQLASSAALAAVGPFCYMVGLLIGPISAVYLGVRRRGNGPAAPYAKCLVPLLGTAAFLLFFIPLKAGDIFARASYGGRPPSQAIAPLRGVLFGVRSTVDLLLLGNCGIRQNTVSPRAAYAALFLLAVFGVCELIRRTDWPGPAILGCAFILLPYLITLPFRAWVQYAEFLLWTRYQLFPQIGVVLLVSAALATWGPRWILARGLSWPHVLLILAIAAVQFLVQVVG